MSGEDLVAPGALERTAASVDDLVASLHSHAKVLEMLMSAYSHEAAGGDLETEVAFANVRGDVGDVLRASKTLAESLAAAARRLHMRGVAGLPTC